MKHYLAFVIALALWLPAHVNAAIFFDTSFETCTVGTHNDFPCEGWDDLGLEWSASLNNNLLEITNVGCFSGSKCLKETFRNHGVEGLNNKPSIYHSVTRTDHIFSRIVVKKDPAYKVCVSNDVTKMWRFRGAGIGAGYPVLMVTMRSGGFTISIEGGYAMGTVNYQGAPSISTNWQNVETELKFNTPGQSDGIIRLWVDGVLYIERLNLQLRGPTPTSVNGQGLLTPSTYNFNQVQVYAQCGDGVNDVPGIIYWDRLAVGDTRIGVVGSLGPTDTVPPTVPAGLAINGNVLTWTASTDGGNPTSGVGSYDIARCGPTFPCTPIGVVGTRTATNFVDTTQVPGEPYSYRVRANDRAGNSSIFTAQVDLAAAPTTNRSIGFPADTFTRADNTDLGTNWTGGYTGQDIARVTSNTMQSTTTGNIAVEGISGYSAPDDQWVKGTLITWGTGTKSAALGVRVTSPTTWTGYYCKVSSASPLFSIVEVTAGTPANLVTTDTVTPAQGDTYYCQIQGTTIRFIKLSGTTEILILSTTDASLASGRVSAYLSNATAGQARWDDISAGGFGAAAAGAITLDAVSSSAVTNTTNTISWTHSIGSCTNKILVVTPEARDDASAADTAVSTVTFGGAPLTKVRHDRITDGSANLGTEAWYLLNPQGSSGTITITWAGALSRSGTGNAVTLCGVDQASPIDAQSGATGTSGATMSSAITTVADNAAIVDAVISRPSSTAIVVGSGQTSRVNREITGVMMSGVSTVLAKTPAGAETMDWTRASGTTWAHSTVSFKPATVLPVVAPQIASMVASTAGMTVTFGVTTPTSIRIDRGTNSGSVVYNTVHPISEFPGGVYTKSGGWEAGLDYIGAHAIDSAGVENLVNYIYGSNASGTSAGFSAAIRQTAAVLSNAQPANSLPSGTTGTTISFNMDVSSPCRYDTTDIAYESMANEMTVSSLTASAAVTGLTDNSTRLYYGRCNYTNELLDEYANSASIAITVTVAAAPGDTTLPSTITTGLICDKLGACTWPIATDNVAIRGYRISLSTDACVTFNLVGNPTTNSYQFPSLSFNQAYCVVVRAEDTSSNLSLADSNQATFTTDPLLDVIPPSRMTGLRANRTFTASVELAFDAPVDSDVISATIQSCQGAGCVNFSNTVTTSTGTQTLVSANLVAGTVNRFRGYFFDGTNVSASLSDIIDVTTGTTGLPGGRSVVPFGVTRDSGSRSAAGTRPLRP